MMLILYYQNLTFPSNGADTAFAAGVAPNGIVQLAQLVIKLYQTVIVGDQLVLFRVGQEALVSADDTAEKMVGLLMRKLQSQAGDRVLLYINGVGGTTHMEMNIVFRRAYQVLEAAGVKVVDGRIAEMLTVQEQSGFQMILAKMDDDHIDYLKNHMANAPYWTTVGK